MIKNIIFDMGGVLVDLTGERCMEAFSEIGATPIVDYVRNHLTADLFYDIEIGNITTADFCDEVRRMSNMDATNEKIIWAWNELLSGGIAQEKKQRMLELKEKGYRLFLLSNTNDMHWVKCRDDHFPMGEYGTDDYFEKVFLSYEMQLAKPGVAIFEEAIRQAGIKPEETIFIDDSAANLKGAAVAGLHTFHESEGHRWLSQLEEEMMKL